MPEEAAVSQRLYRVSEMSCDHCKTAIEGAVLPLAGVTQIDVDLDTKIVSVVGGDDAEIVAAIDEAGYDGELVAN